VRCEDKGCAAVADLVRLLPTPLTGLATPPPHTNLLYRACGLGAAPGAAAAAAVRGFPPASFDCVLLDAPCTALGLRPRLQQALTLPQLLEAAAYQRKLLAAAVQLVRKGGSLVYSTCSISPGVLSLLRGVGPARHGTPLTRRLRCTPVCRRS
jgi:hypothetical protein